MNEPVIFISYSHLDELWKERLSKHLGIAQQQGLLQTWDDRQLRGGDDWFNEIVNAIEGGSVAVLLVSHNSLTSNFILNEEVPRMLAQRELKKARFYPVVVEACDWEAVEWLKPFNLRPRDARPVGINKDGFRTEEQINQDLAAIAKEIRLLPPLKSVTPRDHECPYLGLEAFTEDKRHLFFGRDNFIEAIRQKLQTHQFVVVVGPSGSGKSSVVQAGVFPRLGDEWCKLVFQPGDDPFLNLADKFVEVRGARYRHFSERSKAVKAIAQQIRDNHSIAATVAETLAALPQPGHLLLVADQFEELFTLTTTADRQPFVEALLAAAQLEELKVLVTLRADFLGQAQNLPAPFSQLLDDCTVNHRRLERGDWEAVILQPAKTVGLHVDPALVVLILEEIEAQPDSLPLLEYALTELWQHRAQDRIGLAQYEAIGKLAGAINQRADAVLAQLPAEQQSLALRALTRLVRVSSGEENGADTRLRKPLRELPEEERDLLLKLAEPDARLLVTNRHDRTGEETIEVAHEALIRRWEKLRGALDDDREFLLWRRRVEVRRKQWEQKARDDKWLLLGGDYDESHGWLNERGAELDIAEKEFITWADRPDFQIECILAKAPDLLPFSDGKIRQDWFATLVFCGEQEKALSITREIEYAYDRSHALSSIAKAMVKAELTTEARVVEAEALNAAREIGDANARLQALSSIAEAMVKEGLAMEAREVIAEALTAAREVNEKDDRSGALSSIAEVMAKAGLTKESLDAAREIEYLFVRSHTLSSIAEALVKAGLTTEALAAAREIGDAYDRSHTLSSIGIVMVKAELITEARVVAAEALAAAREIGDANARRQALSSTAKALVKAKLITEVREVITEALDTAREIEDADARRRALSSIAEAAVKAGLTIDALAAAREIEEADDRSRVLSSIAEAMVKAGLTTEALATAREIGEADDRSRVLSSIAEAMVKGELITEARVVAAEALDAVRKIKYAYIYRQPLSSIAEALVKVGLTTDALAAAREIENAYYRNQALSSIAEAMVKVGLTTETLAVAHEFENADDRATALMSVADFWLKQGQVVKAESLLQEIQSAISKIYSSGSRSSAERELAVILARLYRYSEARKYADQCHQDERLAAYTAIFREYHIERNPSLARLFTEEVAEAKDED